MEPWSWVPLSGRLAKELGLWACVDVSDYPRVMQHKWYARRMKNGAIYVYRTDGETSLHRFVMGLGKGRRPVVDHWNRCPLDCRRINLRVCGQSQNCANSGMRRNNRSGYKGVSRHGSGWRAVINSGGRQRCLGHFPSPELAAAAYDAAAVRLFGPFALTNQMIRERESDAAA